MDALAGFGARPAVVAEGVRISYGALASRICERGAELGAGRRVVMIRGGNDVETLVTYLAALQAGHVAWLVPRACEGVFRSSPRALEPDVVVSCAAAAVTIHERCAGSAHRLHPDLALLLGTSGSTGSPRLVRLSHENLHSNAAAIAQYLGITEADRPVTSLPMHYCYGLSVINSHLLQGAALLLTDRSVTDPGFWSLFREGGGTSFAGVPHTFDLLDRIGFEEMALPTLRYVTQAGGRLAPASVRRYAEVGSRRGWRLVVMYGQTEATSRMAYLPPHLAATDPRAIGVPIPGGSFELRQVAESDDPEVGEIVYRGPNVMLGYADSARDLALGGVVHELRTGDLGRRDAAGLYEIVGRRSRFLKLFGLRVDLDEIERMLHRAGFAAVCTGTDQCLVVAVGGVDAPPWLARTLARQLGIPPASILIRRVDEISRLPNGKPDYAALTAARRPDSGERPVSDISRPAATSPRGADSTIVAAVFCEVLDRHRVSENDTFSGLGGDSLSYVEMSLALEEVLGHLPAGWPEMSVREMALLRRRRVRGTRVETNVVLRAGAILLVVASHMTAFWPAGGAHVLLALAGHSYARFQLGGMPSPHRFARSVATVARIAVPTSAWIALVALVTGGYSLGALLLVNNYTGAQALTGGRWHYWFLEALVQILVVLTVLFCVPVVRRLERHHAFAFALGLLAITLVFRFELLSLGAGDNRVFRPHTVVWIFVLGWAVHRATTRWQRLLVSALVVACVPGFFGETAREAIVVSSLLVLVWVPVIVVPRRLSRVVGLIAAASMYIYLTHWQVWPPLSEVLPAAVVFAITIAVGILAWLAMGRLVTRVGAPPSLDRLRRGARSSTAPTGPAGPRPLHGRLPAPVRPSERALRRPVPR